MSVAVTGRETWPIGCCLKLTAGSQLSSVDHVVVPSLGPGCGHDLTLNITSPAEHGVYSAHWRLTTFTGTQFGGLHDR